MMDNKFTKSNFLKVSQEVLDFQLSTLYPVHVNHDTERVNLVFLNHDRNFSTFLTIIYLAEHDRVADIYTLSRSMFESAVSMGLLAKSLILNDLNRYQDYQFVETYKCHCHLEKLGLSNLSGITSSDIPMLKAKYDEYLSKYGKGVSTWTGKSLQQNVELLDKHLPPTCNEKHFYEYLYCQAYRIGSTTTHSSFAGLKKCVDIEKVDLPGSFSAQRFTANEPNLIFSCFHSILVFLSSVRFMGFVTNKTNTEAYFQKLARYIISEGE
jgi:hypothetical protein